jgi:hypothetical protein
VKSDAGKTEWRLLPWRELEEVARAFMHGNTKYHENDWQGVEGKPAKYFDACMRHLTAWWGGEYIDPESGLHHLAHAICCLLILLWNKNNEGES